jgi:hypothetical protein
MRQRNVGGVTLGNGFHPSLISLSDLTSQVRFLDYSCHNNYEGWQGRRFETLIIALGRMQP